MMGNGMMGCSGGMAMMWLLVLLILGIVGYVAYRYGQSQGSGQSKHGMNESIQNDQALAIARRRYAQGEIDRDEFERLRRELA
jgi:uncharacterized membrane protein